MAIDDRTRAEIERALGRRLDRRDFLRIAALGGTAVGTAAIIAACGPGAASSAPASAAPAPPRRAVGRRGVRIGRRGRRASHQDRLRQPRRPGRSRASRRPTTSSSTASPRPSATGSQRRRLDCTRSRSSPRTASPIRTARPRSRASSSPTTASTSCSSRRRPRPTNPVADQCEANGVPVHLVGGAWQPYFLVARRRTRRRPTASRSQWTYHFFWGLEDIISVFLDMWSQVDTNKIVGGLFPNDGDGNAWGDPAVGFPTPLKAPATRSSTRAATRT